MKNNKTNTLLDDDFGNRWGNKVFRPEDIKWEGEPGEKEFSVLWLEGNHASGIETGGYNPGLGSFSMVVFIATIVLAYVGMSIYSGHGMSMSIWLLLLGMIILIIAPDLYMKYAHRKTRYAVTDSQVLFNLFHWGKEKIHTLNWEEVAKVSWEEYENGTGTLYFMCYEKQDFYTYNFTNGNRRMHLSFELVPNVKEVFEKLELLHKAKKVSREGVAVKKENPSEIEGFKRKVQFFQSIIFGYLLWHLYIIYADGAFAQKMNRYFVELLFFAILMIVILLSQLLLVIEKEKVDKFYLQKMMVWTLVFLFLFIFFSFKYT